MKNIKNERAKGITLIALVITIVVLIILATISINVVIGEGGILEKAREAKTLHEQGEAGEQTGMEKMANDMTQYYPKPSTVTYIPDGKGGTVPLPNGFYYVNGNLDTGIVISDKQGDTLDASGTEMGNQFVWIPATEDDLTRTLFDTNGQAIAGLGTNYTEPYASGSDEEKEDYNTMVKQVKKYNGFYIGRYEAGVDSTKLRTGYTEAQKVVSKKGVAPYNYVPWGKGMSDTSEVTGRSGAVQLAKKMYSTSDSVISTITFGSQWDAMCRYIGDSGRTTPAKQAVKVELTGSVEGDKSKNIYDLAGNCSEWTMEAIDTDKRALRAGNYYYANPISLRHTFNPSEGYDTVTFRVALCIK